VLKPNTLKTITRRTRTTTTTTTSVLHHAHLLGIWSHTTLLFELLMQSG